ncbi:N-alpha-acetyltransferase 20 isoform X4 [Talpa occidentalis]|nr:N-alpha-acetyltransferase 20 isoform X4 [Talpa occidentalis]
MNDAQLVLQQRDYCAHYLILLLKCKRDSFPNFLACKHEQHDWDYCEHLDYVKRMKEFEQERRLLQRKQRNLDPLTETYGIPFYLQYLAHWPEYFIVAEAPGGELMGYIMGKAEGSVAREEWHGHVTALSVAPEFRRLGLAAKLMELLEEISERKGGFFVDLFVRVSNQVAVNMYKQLGYSVYRTVIEYYSASNGEPDEDAYDMRKALSRDTEKKSIIPLPHPVRPEDIE